MTSDPSSAQRPRLPIARLAEQSDKPLANAFGAIVGVVVVPRSGYGDSCEDVFHHMPMHIGEAVITACVAVGELFVVDAEEMQDGGL